MVGENWTKNWQKQANLYWSFKDASKVWFVDEKGKDTFAKRVYTRDNKHIVFSSPWYLDPNKKETVSVIVETKDKRVCRAKFAVKYYQVDQTQIATGIVRIAPLSGEFPKSHIEQQPNAVPHTYSSEYEKAFSIAASNFQFSG